MKLTFETSGIEKVKKGVTPIFLIEGDKTRFVEGKNRQTSLHVGVGVKKEITQRKFILLCRKVIMTAKSHKIDRIAINFDHISFPLLKKIGDERVATLVGENFEMANFLFTTFRTKPKDGWGEIKEIVVCGKADRKIQDALKRGLIVGEYVNKCRELANAPGGDMTPDMLAKEAKKMAGGTGAGVKVLGQKELLKLKMGAILGVAQGSKEEPKLILMEYKGGGKEKPIVLIGKGVTFDTGGINLKPGDSSLGMHMDMSGGAAVISAVALAAKLKVKKNVVGIIPAVENMPSGESYRPGDVLKSMSGKTIEVMNTDAEGRVILADAITYSKKYSPRLVVDVATLTGASIVAIGQRANVFMTKEKKFEKLFMDLGEESGDYMWQLPLWEEYEEEVKGSRGDVTNTNNKGGRGGGAINGGIFLHEFARDMPWVHIDMAPRMETIPSDNLSAGAAGEPVRLFLKLVERF